MKTLAIRTVRHTAGCALGAATAVVELPLTLLCGLLLLLAGIRPGAARAVPRPVGAVAAALLAVERRRLARFFGIRIAPAPDDARALRYLAVRWALGALGGAVAGLVLVGMAYSSLFLYAWWLDDIAYPLAVVFSNFGGLLLLFLACQGVFGTVMLEEQLARRLLGPSHHDALERRITELATTRAEMMEAVDGERRRIERDLHDGVQQRLVALGMLLGRARRSHDPAHTDALLLQAHEESRRALVELREVAWRVYPTVLDEAGLRAALETVAERTPLPVRVDYAVPVPPPRQTGTVAYFVVSEAVTNVVKHSGATRVEVRVDRDGDRLRLRIEDDGTGGADPTGGGLTGLARRVAALDGRFGVHSPAGGPTAITAELPCA
ncbi:sensor histidine kinase [Streptomyces sp. t39]|uniref:sensor histidine kinase n=1 Tax=Streptomyces sp. t39 TaxID=1828156 RepID=UPI0011CEC44A|nr:sensor histidine kinase [Streptomyces sp. t39]TXS54972.1 sensor histidine kinase [Streptomyces sp. t39]